MKRLVIKYLKKITLVCVYLGLITGTGIAGYLYYLSQDLPTLKAVKNPVYNLPTRIYDRNGTLVDEFYIHRRVLTPINRVPKVMINALLATEDSRFYSHFGIDPIRMVKALIVDIIKRDFSQGASTLTQQTAKQFLLSSEKKITRKLKEILLALKMENELSKDRILELYLNKTYFGHGAYGIEAAAQSYFSKTTDELNLLEAAMLAGLPQAPSSWAPTASMKNALRRRNLVLRMMRDQEYITQTEMEEAVLQPIKLKLNKEEGTTEISYYMEHVRKYLIEKYGKNKLYSGGLKVYTAMDLDYQVKAQEALKKGLYDLDKRQGFRGVEENITDASGDIIAAKLEMMVANNQIDIGNIATGVVSEVGKDYAKVILGKETGTIFLDSVIWANTVEEKQENPRVEVRNLATVLKKGDVIQTEILDYQGQEKGFILTLSQEPEANGAILSVDPSNGDVLAISGGFSFEKSEFNRATQSKRQPGSAFKPIVYTAALENTYTAATMLDDSPLVFRDRFKWMPKNYNGKFMGKIPLRTALANSKNVPTVKLLISLGVDTVIDYARNLGITTPIPRDYSISLGSAAVTLEELVGVYGIFANHGRNNTPIYVKRIEDRNGHVIEENKTTQAQIVSEDTAFVMTTILNDVVKKGTGWRAKAINRPSAGKTGTTNNNTDAWYMGYIPQILTGVYVGFDDQRKVLGHGETGSRAAAPIWVDYMKYVTESLPILPFEQPRTVEQVKIDSKTGMLACGVRNRKTRFEYFASGTVPTKCYSPVLTESSLANDNYDSNVSSISDDTEGTIEEL